MFKRIVGFMFVIASLAHPYLMSDDNFDCLERKHHKQPTNFIAPVFQVPLIPCPITENSAVSFLGEAGPKSYRIGGTFGIIESQCRLKFSVEQLGQRLQYRFSNGKVHRWMHQYAIGGVYEYQLCNSWVKSLNIDTTYSRAFSRSLRSVECPSSTSILERSIAGGRNAHIGAGVTLTPWQCSWITLSADWDSTSYKRPGLCNKKYSGLGGSARLLQLLPCDLSFDVAGEFRRPFNYYEAGFGFAKNFYCTSLNFRLYGSYTQGQERIPSVGTIGLSLSVAFGGGPMFPSCCSFNACDSTYGGSSYDPYACCCQQPMCLYNSDLLYWVSEPAVYMPVVLAIPTEKLHNTGSTVCPLQVGQLPNPVTFSFTGQTFSFAPFFSGTAPLSFSIDPVIPNFILDPATGVLTYTGPAPQQDQQFNVLLTVSNACGSVVTPVTILLTGNPPCTPVSQIQQLSDPIQFIDSIPSALNLAPFFTGTAPLVFQLTFLGPATPQITLTPSGVLNYAGGLAAGFNTTVLVTVTNSCGQVFAQTQISIISQGGCIPVSFTPGANPLPIPATVGVPVDISSYFSGTPPLTFAISMFSPPGFTITPNGLLTYIGAFPPPGPNPQAVVVDVSNLCPSLLAQQLPINVSGP